MCFPDSAGQNLQRKARTLDPGRCARRRRLVRFLGPGCACRRAGAESRRQLPRGREEPREGRGGACAAPAGFGMEDSECQNDTLSISKKYAFG